MKTVEEKLEEIQFMLEHLELKIHRKLMEKANEKEFSFTYPN